MAHPVSLGVIGCGNRTRHLLKMLLSKTPDVKLVAACDPLPEQREGFRRDYNPDLALFDDDAAFFAHPGMEWVMIGSWNVHHRRHIEAALKQGLNIFCEKPLATTQEDVAAILKMARASDRRIMMSFTLRYSPLYRKIRELLDSGIIGKLVSFEFNETIGFNHGGHIMRDWRRRTVNSGGHLLEKCCHDMDLANWMVGALPVSVASFGGNDFFRPENAGHMDRIGMDGNGKQAYCNWNNIGGNAHPFSGDNDIVDNQVAILQYANGVRATFHTNTNAGILERRMYLLGTEGALRADCITGKIEFSRIGFNNRVEVLDMLDTPGGHGGGDDVLIDYFGKMMTEGAPSLTPVTGGVSSAVICLSIDESRNEGRVVDLSPRWKALSIDPCAPESSAEKQHRVLV